MSEITIIQNSGYRCNLWVTPMMEKLVNEIYSPLCEYSVGLVPAGYYALPEECLRGDFGYNGYLPPDIVKVPFTENTETLRCIFTCNSNIKEILDQIKQLSSELYVTPGNNSRKHIVYIVNENYLYENITENYYLCKKEIFDAYVIKLKELGIDSTIDDIIDSNTGEQNIHHDPYIEYNTTFTYVAQQMPLDLNTILRTVVRQYNKKIGISNYTIVLNIIATDIEINYEKIIQLSRLILKYS